MIEKSIETLKGIGEKNLKLFQHLGISTIGDMLKFYPRFYSDRTVKPIREIGGGQIGCIRITALAPIKSMRTKSKLTVHKLYATDGNDTITITWFNQDWLAQNFDYNGWYNAYGDVSVSLYGKEMALRVLERSDKATTTNANVPVYSLTKNLSHNMVVKTIKQCIPYVSEIPENLPPYIREKYGLCGIGYAISNIHFPKNNQAAFFARNRLAFDELFYLQLGLRLLNKAKNKLKGTVFDNGTEIASDFIKKLPYQLTNAQLNTVKDIINDTKSGKLMNRLVQGDVGCGKTVVAAIALLIAAKNGGQGAMMAPTEILAKQHYSYLKDVLDVNVVLLTGNLRAKEKREALQKIKDGSYSVIVGTHALIQKDVEFNNLSLVVTDEQHRFGVEQRSALSGKGKMPHTLVMTATPIPRTLALVLYGDLDVSVINEMPPGRKEVKTYSVDENMRERINNFMIKNINEGRQVYIVCPMVNENEATELKAVTEFAKSLQNTVFSGYTVDVIHGKLKGTEKDEIMSRFVSGETNVLVSTTVIEVGVNVPNASVMVIENAERFGLSQLHQLRGRVGRGQWQSYCIMFCDGGEVAQNRMKVMTDTNDGFVIAEQDLKLRGPGEFFGTSQHGLPPLTIANLYEDLDLVKIAGDAVTDILNADSNLSKPENKIIRQDVIKMYKGNITL
ncbi:MAG: ATP-dependent DNA helicase RecG [Clostridia bacterium]|nr:ATP-dependent DNA helicase RecG [Clostridia bacterium]MBQ9997920.1 ATP-dependent DNA helicase RecG [Clostridia bacterium]